MERTGEGEGDVGVRELLDVPADDIAQHLLGQAEVVVLRAHKVNHLKSVHSSDAIQRCRRRQ
jgi:hypothetical protein